LAQQRIIGFIRHSPSIAFNVTPGGFTEDWAVLELDGPKFREFRGNAINIGMSSYLFFSNCIDEQLKA